MYCWELFDKGWRGPNGTKKWSEFPVQSLCKPPSGIELFRTDYFFVTFWQDFPKRYENIFWLKQRSKCSLSYSPLEGLCCNSKYRTNVIDHFSFGFFLHFSYQSSCRKDQFTVLILNVPCLLLDYIAIKTTYALLSASFLMAHALSHGAMSGPP